LLFSILLATLSFAAELPFDDSKFGCLEPAAADRYVRDFGVDVQSFGGLELCDGRRETKKLLNDLYLIEKTEFAAPVNHPFIRGFVDRNNYYGWMKSQTRGVERGNDIPWATAYNSGGYFTMQDGWAVLSTLGRVGTIIHEARHTAGYRHYPCASGPYGNTRLAGCDTTYAQGGSHGVEMEYYARAVLEAKNLHPVYQSMARLMALGRSNFVFNEQPMKKREALVAVGEGRVVMADGTNLTEAVAPAREANAPLKRTSFGAAFFNGAQTQALDLYGPLAGANLADDYSYFKLFKDSRGGVPATFRAVEEIDVGNLRFLAILTNEGSVLSYNFSQGAWHPPSATLRNAAEFVTLTPSGAEGLFVVTTSGSIVPFNLTTRRFGPPLAERWPADTRSFAKLGGRIVGLKASGELLDQSGAPVPGFTRSFTDLINVPLYDAFEVAP